MWIIGMYRIIWIVCSWSMRPRCRERMRGRQWGERMGRCGGAMWSHCHWRCGLMWTMHVGICDRQRKVFFVRTSLLSTTTKQASEARIVFELRMCVEVCLNDLNELLLLEFLPSLHWYHKCHDDLHKVVLVFGGEWFLKCQCWTSCIPLSSLHSSQDLSLLLCLSQLLLLVFLSCNMLVELCQASSTCDPVRI